MWGKSAIVVALSLWGVVGARAVEPVDARVVIKPVCLPSSEISEEIRAHHLIESFAALKSAQAQYKAEPLSAKLCRLGDEFIYIIALLHRDGKYVHVWMNATTGKWIDNHRPREPAPRETQTVKP